MNHIAIMGIGNMGFGIAQNLLKAGYELSVYNRTPQKAKPLLDNGAHWANTPRQAAENAEVIFSVVGDDAASRSMWLGKDGALASAPAGCVAVECTTLSLPWVRELQAAVEAKDLAFMDAPLAGSKLAAESGALTLFVGAMPETLKKIQPVLERISERQIHFGPPVSGAAYKLINNMMAATHLAALGEGIALAERFGLKPDIVLKAITSGAVSSPVVKGKAENVLDRRYSDPHFALRWMHKDITYALRLADELGVPVPVAAAVHEIYRMAIQQGYANQDWSAVTEVVRGT